MVEQQVIEGTWEEVVSQAERLGMNGRRVKLIVPTDSSEVDQRRRNEAAIAFIDERLRESRAVPPEEREEGEREWEEFRANLEANRGCF